MQAQHRRLDQELGEHVRFGAPSALRMPISRVRSVTVTIMMLVMPMPPTSRLIAGHRAEQQGERLGGVGPGLPAAATGSGCGTARCRAGDVQLAALRIAVTSAWAAVTVSAPSPGSGSG